MNVEEPGNRGPATRSWTSRLIALGLLALFLHFFTDNLLEVKIAIFVLMVAIFTILPILIDFIRKQMSRTRSR